MFRRIFRDSLWWCRCPWCNKGIIKIPQTRALIEVSLDKNAKDAVITSGKLDSKSGQFQPTEIANTVDSRFGKGTTVDSPFKELSIDEIAAINRSHDVSYSIDR